MTVKSLREVVCRNCAADFTYAAGGGVDRPLCPTCETTHKWCPPCGYALVHAAFTTDRSVRGGLEGVCRQCKRAAGRARQPYKKRPDPRKARANKILRRYGLTQEQWDELVLAHAGKCAICDEPTPDLHIDHCHTTLVVRGLLCPPCNKGLGHFSDDLDTMVSAVAYLMASQDSSA